MVATSTIVPFRIFLSSPGDRVAERAHLRDLVDGELQKDPAFRTRLKIDLVSWDDPAADVPLEAQRSPQAAVDAGLPLPSQCDVVIVVVGARMGTPLPEDVRRPDGSRYLSGTEYEYEQAAAAAKDAGSGPSILIYQDMQPPPLDVQAADAAAKRQQHEAAQAFCDRVRAAGGGVNEYASIEHFRRASEHHLRLKLHARLEAMADADAAQLGGATGAEVPAWLAEELVPALRNLTREADDLHVKSDLVLAHAPDGADALKQQFDDLEDGLRRYEAARQKVRSRSPAFQRRLSSLGSAMPELFQAAHEAMTAFASGFSAYPVPRVEGDASPLKQHRRLDRRWREIRNELGAQLVGARDAIAVLETGMLRRQRQARAASGETVAQASAAAIAMLEAYFSACESAGDAVEVFAGRGLSGLESLRTSAWELLAPAITNMNNAYIAYENGELALRMTLVREAGPSPDYRGVVDTLGLVADHNWRAVRPELNALLSNIFVALLETDDDDLLDAVREAQTHRWPPLAELLRGTRTVCSVDLP